MELLEEVNKVTYTVARRHTDGSLWSSLFEYDTYDEAEDARLELDGQLMVTTIDDYFVVRIESSNKIYRGW